MGRKGGVGGPCHYLLHNKRAYVQRMLRAGSILGDAYTKARSGDVSKQGGIMGPSHLQVALAVTKMSSSAQRVLCLL